MPYDKDGNPVDKYGELVRKCASKLDSGLVQIGGDSFGDKY